MVLPRPQGEIERAFEEYFAKRGIVLETTVLDYSGRAADQPGLIARLRQLAPDLICTYGAPSTTAVVGLVDSDPRKYIRDIPVVFTSVADPIAARLVTDLGRPGRNVTGVSPIAPLPIQLNAIGAYRPYRALGFLYDDTRPSSQAIRTQLRALARTRGFILIDQPVPRSAEGNLDLEAIPALVGDIKARGADFLYIGPDTFLTAPMQDAVTHAALANGLPTFAALESTVRTSGALAGLFSPQAAIGRLAASKALRLLTREASPADEPIEPLQHFSPLINMRTARILRTYPPLLLLDVAEVVADNSHGRQAGAAGHAPLALPVPTSFRLAGALTYN